MNALGQRSFGIPVWAYLLAAVAICIASAYAYGWPGLSPNEAPLGFRLPLLLVGFLILGIAEIGRSREVSGRERGESCGRLTSIVGYSVISNASQTVFWIGLALGVLGPFVVPALYSALEKGRGRESGIRVGER